MALDLDAVTAEATTTEPFKFTFGGEKYKVTAENADMRIVIRMTDNELAEALRLMLGAEQYARLDASPEAFTDERLAALYEGWCAHYGLGEPGKSEASSS